MDWWRWREKRSSCMRLYAGVVDFLASLMCRAKLCRFERVEEVIGDTIRCGGCCAGLIEHSIWVPRDGYVLTNTEVGYFRGLNKAGGRSKS